MSSIVGNFNLDGQPVDQNDVARMIATLERRVPDGSDVWYEGVAGTGHTMLENMLESKYERLPTLTAEGDNVITAEARIGSRDELINLL